MKKYILPVLSVCFLFIIFSPFEDSLWPKWYVFYLGLSGYGGYYLGKRYHTSLGLLFFSVLFSGSMVFANKSFYSNEHIIVQLDLAKNAAQATLAFLCMMTVGLVLKKSMIELLLKSYIFVCALHCVYVLCEYFLMGKPYFESIGFLPNISMGPSMLGVLFPLVVWKAAIKQKAIYLYIGMLFLSVIYLHGSSMGYACFVSGVISLVFFSLWAVDKKASVAICLVLLAVLLPLGYFIDSQWYTPHKIDRIQFWRVFLTWWEENVNPLFGSGTGTFRHIGPMIQNENKMQIGSWWLWAHSDWVQVLFELGWIGVVSSIYFIVTCIERAYNAARFEILAGLVAYVVMAAGNYPLRLAEFAFLGMLLLSCAFKSRAFNDKESLFK